jgi:hypothetical protein
MGGKSKNRRVGEAWARAASPDPAVFRRRTRNVAERVLLPGWAYRVKSRARPLGELGEQSLRCKR